VRNCLKGGKTIRKKLSVVDTHAHLDMAPFNKDRAEVMARARDSGVSTIITVGIDLASSEQAVKLAESYRGVFASAGFHPHNVTGVDEADITKLAQITGHSRVVAIGEVGLDFYRDYSPHEAQLGVLKRQLALASELDLPVIVHCRRAEKALIPLLRDWVSGDKRFPKQPPGVIHCFSGDGDTAQQYLKAGFFLSLGAYIGYPSSASLHGVIRSIPGDRLLVETDCPYLPPQGRRGQRNEPAYLLSTVELLAEIREVSVEQLARETTENARYLFRLPED
jgi:TatD DNase family protein